MEIEKIVQKITQNKLTAQEVFQWEDSSSNNLLHILAVHDDHDLFNQASKLLNKKQLSEKLTQTNDLGDTPGHLAAWSGNLCALKQTVQTIGHLDLVDFKNRNVAMISIKNKNPEVIDYVLDNTKNINLQDKSQQTVLHYAENFSNSYAYQKIISLGGNEEIVNRLNKKAVSPVNQSEDDILDFVQTHKKKVK